MAVRRNAARLGVVPLVALATLLCGCAERRVAVREEAFALPRYVREFWTEPATQPNKRPRRRSREKLDGMATFASVVLANEYLRVRVLPEWGGQVYSAVFKPTGDDLFHRDRVARHYFPFLQAGVRASFPQAEHGMPCMGQPTGWRIVRRPDGSAMLAMWLEFAHNHEASPNRTGKYTHLTLSQFVTLAPGEATFAVTYRIVNPAPYRVGRQCWSDAFFPRNHTADGVVCSDDVPPGRTDTEWIYPATHASTHRGADFRRYTAREDRIADAKRSDTSVFAWDMPYGFAGLWYPQVRISRLRLGDAANAPGAKQYYRGEGRWTDWGGGYSAKAMFNMVELWGGSDCVFEGVERWLGAGEAWQFTHRYALVRGIGKVDYADPNLAVNVEFGTDRPRVEVVTFRRAAKLTAALNGLPLPGAGPCAPDRPAVFSLPSGLRRGRLALADDGKVLLDRAFPLEMPPAPARAEQIKAALAGDSGVAAEMTGNAARRHKWHYRNALGRYAQGTTARGRVLYRDGQIAAAIECLRTAAADDEADGEARHLLGAALLEAGRPAEAAEAFRSAVAEGRAHPPARYFLALRAVAGGDDAAARRELGLLLRDRPAHWEGRLLLAWLEATRTDGRASADRARQMEQEDPADPRVQYVLAHAPAGQDAAAEAARQLLAALLDTPGAPRRLAEFQAATRGEYMHPNRAGGS